MCCPPRLTIARRRLSDNDCSSSRFGNYSRRLSRGLRLLTDMSRLADLRHLTLYHLPELAFPAVDQVVVRAVLDHSATFEQDHSIGLGDGGEAMGDEDDGDVRVVEEMIQSSVHCSFRLGVEST